MIKNSSLLTLTPSSFDEVQVRPNFGQLSLAAKKLVNEAASNPTILARFVNEPEAAWLEFGGGIDAAERRVLELLAEIFLPGTSAPIVIVLGDGLWVESH